VKLDTDQLQGCVALVGAGPSDPELLTLRAYRLLARADVILVDNLVDERILQCCRDDARIINVGKTPRGKKTSQQVINALLVKEARSGHFVVRLKGGDPFVFGRGAEEAIELGRHGIPCEVVPGISSCIAAPQAASIPVTHRGVTTHFSVVTGVGARGKGVQALRQAWKTLASAGGTVVFLMGVGKLPQIVEAVLEAGRASDTPCALIEQATTGDERVVEATLATIVETAQREKIRPPATFVLGDVVGLRSQIISVSRETTELTSRVG